MRVEDSVEMKKQKEKIIFTDRLRIIFSKLLEWAGNLLNDWGVNPNVLTTTGVIGTAVGAFFVAQGKFFIGGFIILLMGPIDALDGAVARAKGEPEDFGAFVDSVSDRYIEMIIFGSLLWYFVGQEQLNAVMIVFLAASGSVLVSYTRARAQSLGFDTKVGILTRVERILVIGPSILFGIPLIGAAIVAVGANITAIQRVIDVRRQAQSQKIEQSQTSEE
ncbi:MAG: CDP-alcohol phosphatidyltransferase family protein [Chloroflexi bacterium]|jgi:CDP-diacylglycerol---glycerol-3-phosphate 3-phosphatidyltransferase|nr:CDP-alcohol phosphatidyltransferase family protein [Chloroflexota bacterium]MBT4003926.1 CDP-alcohol phosphatidyltransferase family protein [Chloroflexota bacterium]MBT4305768.1 CDP-alcohol phosphatidyltransferase family protein [Chloroflexota bacterium]MBT4533592.1 CDP-alcohol phosphatidyltransferase family protein [Chloroflexota bacterium]MBT4681765.1 CDP-alcohol phosphatidyltransferase family protein [Chloroflexota bacterium]